MADISEYIVPSEDAGTHYVISSQDIVDLLGIPKPEASLWMTWMDQGNLHISIREQPEHMKENLRLYAEEKEAAAQLELETGESDE